MILAIISLIIYAVSPLVLLPWLIVTKVKNKELQEELRKAENNSKELAGSLRRLYAESHPQSETQVVEEPELKEEVPETPSLVNMVREAAVQVEPEEKPVVRNVIVNERTEAEKKVSTISIMLTLGAILISIAGIVFATTTWGNLGNIARAITVLSFSFVFFIISLIAEKALKIPKTGTVFYVLGSVFLPITVIAAGFFNLFGNWFSLDGDGKMLLWSTVFLTYMIAAFRGTLSYRSKVFAWTSLASLSAMVCCLLGFFTQKIGIYSACLAVYALAVIVGMRLFENGGERKFEIFFSVLKSFSICNLVALSLVAFVAPFIDDKAVFVVISAAIFAASWFVAQPVFEAGGIFAIPFALFVTIALCKPVANYGVEQVLLMITVSMAVNMCLSFVKQISERFRSVLMVLGLVGEAVLLLVLMMVAFDDYDITILASFIVLSATCTALWFFNQNHIYGKIFKLYIPAAFVGLVVTLMQLTTEALEASIIIKCLLVVAAMLALQILFVLLKGLRLRTTVSDFVFAGAAIIASMIARHADEYIVPYSATSALLRVTIVLAAAVSFLILFDRGENYSPIKNVVATLTGSITLTQLPFVFIEYDVDECGLPMLIYAIVFVLVSLGLFVVTRNKEKRHAVETLTYFAMFITTVFAFAELALLKDIFFLVHELMLLMFCGISKLLKAKNEPEKTALEPASRYVFFGFNLVFSVILILSYDISVLQFIMAIIATILVIIFACRSENNGYAIASVIGLMTLSVHYPVVLGAAVGFEYMAVALMFMISCGLSLWLYRDRLVRKTEDAVAIDIFAVTRPMLVLILLSCAENDVARWISILLAGITVLGFIKTQHQKNVIKAIVCLAAVSLVPAWIFQPFFQFSDIIKLEMILLPIVVYVIAIKLAWKNTKAEATIEHCMFAVLIVSFGILIVDALISAETIDALIIAVAATILVIYSFIVKHKRWFILGSVIVLGIALRMTWDFWASLDWWVYLMSAGVIFLAIGITNEVRKKRAETGKTGAEERKKTRFMSDWSW